MKQHKKNLWIRREILLVCSVFLTFLSILSGCGRQPVVLQLEDTVDSAQEDSVMIEENTEPVPARIMVDICGAVLYPGVYELNEESRVCDAILAAGGLREDAAADRVNQAQHLQDEQKIYIPTVEEIQSAEQTESTTVLLPGEGMKLPETVQESTESGKVNLNTADVSALMKLPGVGQTKAEAIVEYRNLHGEFSTIEEIMKVPGIKKGTFDKIMNEITAG